MLRFKAILKEYTRLRKKFIAYLTVPFLYLLIQHNLYARQRGFLPDEWYWADLYLSENGIFIIGNYTWFKIFRFMNPWD